MQPASITLKKRADPFTATRDAFAKGMDFTTKAIGVTGNPDISLYQKLQPQDFQGIGQRYGHAGLINYIKTMEAKRMKKGGE